jgi:chemotaxis protein histidine kinase CheA
MKYRSLWIPLLALLIAGPAFGSAVTEVTLDHKDGGVLASVKVDGTVRFIHQVEGPKGGKPYRVIVDVLAATHQLGQQSYASVPKGCPFTGLRTSQYAVSPEKICRLVFDMKGAPLYKINEVKGGIELFFTDANAAPFPTWSTAEGAAKPSRTPSKTGPADKSTPPAVASTEKASAAAAKKLNEQIQDDRKGSLAAADKPAAAKAPSRTPSRPAVKTEPTAPAQPTKVAPEPAVAKAEPKQPPKAAEKPAVAKAQPKKPTRPSKAVVKAEPTAKSKADPKAKPQPAKKKTVAAKVEPSKTASKKPSKAKAASPPTVAAKKQDAPSKTAPTKTLAEAPPAVPSKKTSRFRRDPGTPSKLKGTMVAEFPKRLVIKYKAKDTRDPFRTLINDSKTDNNPLATRVPNVEGLKLVGIIEAGVGKSNQALFEDVDGYSYILKTGDKVKRGYVLRVEEDRVYFQIFEYGWSRTVALHIEE